MTFDDQDIAAIQSLGYSPDEARFLYLVAVHSGYFVPRQFLTFTGAKWGSRPHNFVSKLEKRGHVTWREYDPIGGVYHLFSKTVYRCTGKGNLSGRHRHSVDFIRTRLLLLDFILENSGFTYFETEPEKTAYFSDVLGIPKEVLPVKTYEGGSGSGPTARYFVDKFPMFLDHTAPGGPPVITFSYIDPGVTRLAGFNNHLRTYLPLLRRLERFSFLYIANSAVHFLEAEKRFSTLVHASLKTDNLTDLLRYFRLRNAWELKQYGSLSTSDVAWLKEASRRFHGERFEDSYRAWASGALTEETLRAEFKPPHLLGNARFRTCLVPLTRFGKRRLAEDRVSALLASASPDA
jgi:hypothetical protein